MPTDTREQRDLVLAPNQYVLILDETKGTVTTHVGPNNIGIQSTQKPVIFDEATRRFEKCTMEEAIKEFVFAGEGSYVVLENPAVLDDKKHPKVGSRDQTPDLDVGRKINIHGPATFPLWPGQIAKVVPGHILRSNEFLVVRVTNDDAAQREWSKAVINPKVAAEGEKPSEAEKPSEIPVLTMGKLLVIKGTEVSFYIPPTGIEVVPDEKKNYVRDAVTLEQIEYCILLNENGDKRYVQGPQVVFPEPNETFFKEEYERKFRAYELNEQMGMYVKVIAPYEDENGTKHLPGEELFVTGKEQKIYFPRPEHAIVKYGDQTIHYAIAIPAGDARYVLYKDTGEVKTVNGSKMLLPDPRKEVVVMRILEDEQIKLWRPGDSEAFERNRALKGKPLTEEELELMRSAVSSGGKEAVAYRMAAPPTTEEFHRKISYTPPRTVTLDYKFEGAVPVKTGYAVQIVPKKGDRRVVLGPTTVILEYDETLEVLKLSTETPKTDAKTIPTVFLRVQNNTVSDKIRAETKDLCQVEITVSYRVNFEGDPTKWFQVENYVKLLTDHLRSKVRSAVRTHGIEEFYANSTAIVRDTVLGASIEGKRTGQKFDENGMRVYDVEVLDVQIGDASIQKMLVQAQQSRVQQALTIAKSQAELDLVKKTEAITQETANAKAETALKALDLQIANKKKDLEAKLAEIEAQGKAALKTLENAFEKQRAEMEMWFSAQQAEWKVAQERQGVEDALLVQKQDALSKAHEAELERLKAKHAEEIAHAENLLKQRLDELRAESEAKVKEMQTVTPEFIAALQTLGDKNLVGALAEHFNVPALLGGDSIVEIARKVLGGPILDRILPKKDD